MSDVLFPDDCFLNLLSQLAAGRRLNVGNLFALLPVHVAWCQEENMTRQTSEIRPLESKVSIALPDY